MSNVQEYRFDSIQKSFTPDDLAASTVAHFFVLGMDCPLCARRVRESLLHQKGVLSARVDLERKFVTAFFDPLQTNLNLLIRAIERSGDSGKRRFWAELYLQVNTEAVVAHANAPVPA
jgi:copper chaperone CopZ